MTDATLYRVLWGALGDDERAALRDVATAAAPEPSHELIDRIREAEQCLDIGGLPVGEVLLDPGYDALAIDAGFLEWVRLRQV